MPKINFQILIYIFIAVAFGFFVVRTMRPIVSPVSKQNSAATQTTPTTISSGNQGEAQPTSNGFVSPLSHAASRVTKKPFGIFITPKNSPVQPERFQGYHTGADFETFPEEENVDVAVNAVCSGKLVYKNYASGYGGVAVQSCTLESKPITVIYGHLKLQSIRADVGGMVNAGDELGILGKGYSSETDGERKHLHLGFHHGTSINILGYVETEAALPDWIDPCLYVCGK